MEYVHDGANSPEDAMLHARIDIQLSETRFYTGMWSVQPCDNVAPLGWVCFSKLSGRDPCSGDDLQLGYQFAPKHWGRGYAIEAASGLLGYGFGTLGLDRVAALVRKANARSVRVLEKLGFGRVGMRTYHCCDEHNHAAYCDCRADGVSQRPACPGTPKPCAGPSAACEISASMTKTRYL